MPAQTTTKIDAAARFDQLTRAWSEAKDEATRLGREHFAARSALQGHLDDRGLAGELRRLQHRDPGQFHPDGRPRRKDSEAGRIQAEIDEVPDVAELAQKVDHARRLEARAKEECNGFIAANFAELVEAQRPRAEAAAAEVSARAADLVAALDGYLNAYAVAARLTEPVQGIGTRVVPGVDAASNYRRAVEEINLPAPIPGVTDGP